MWVLFLVLLNLPFANPTPERAELKLFFNTQEECVKAYEEALTSSSNPSIVYECKFEKVK